MADTGSSKHFNMQMWWGNYNRLQVVAHRERQTIPRLVNFAVEEYVRKHHPDLMDDAYLEEPAGGDATPLERAQRRKVERDQRGQRVVPPQTKPEDPMSDIWESLGGQDEAAKRVRERGLYDPDEHTVSGEKLGPPKSSS